MNKTLFLVVILNILFSQNIFSKELKASKTKAKDETSKTKIELENELVDFSSIRKELKKDGLDDFAKKFTNKVVKTKKTRMKKVRNYYRYPYKNNFWTFISELWLVQNSQILKWDFQKADYGLMKTFSEFLEKFGFYNQKIKILYINSPNISHMALPTDANEYIFLLSVPFIRTLDLSKLEISLILFEDFLRVKAGYFVKNINNKKLEKVLGKSFYKKDFKKKIFADVLKSYDQIAFIKGFNFQQQFNITKLMHTYLINDMKLWNNYYRLLGKLDLLVKSNLMYHKYIKIYPSPELQLNWFKPKKKRKF